MSWQDVVLAVGSVFLTLALLPSVLSQDKPAVATSAMTGSVLASFVVVYASLGLPVTAAITAVAVGLWITLLLQKFRNRSA